MNLREGDRRGVPRRERDRAEHLLTQAVLAAALHWRHVDVDDESARFEAVRRLADTCDDFERFDRETQMGAAKLDLLLLIVVLVVALVPLSVLGRGGLRLLAVGVALGALGALLLRGERET